jgi:putative ABC transport system substrate-binding protein
MKRRDFLAASWVVLLSPAQAVAAAKLVTPAKAVTRGKVSILAFGTAGQFAARLEALKQSLPGVELDPRYAAHDPAALATLAQAIAKAEPAAIVADSILATRALFQATATIPVIMARSEDPVANRVVKTLDQPAGNVTGVVSGSVEWLLESTEVLQAMMPAKAPIGVLLDQNHAAYRPARSRVHYVATQHHREPVYLDADRPRDLERAFAQLKAEKVGGLIVMDGPMFLDEAARIVKLAKAAKVPVIYPDRAYVTAGGAMAHGGDSIAAMARAGAIVKRVLEGAHPANIAVESLPAAWYVNRAAAKAQALKIPDKVSRAAKAA